MRYRGPSLEGPIDQCFSAVKRCCNCGHLFIVEPYCVPHGAPAVSCVQVAERARRGAPRRHGAVPRALFFELTVECTFPIAEGASASMIMLIDNLIQVAFLIVPVDKVGKAWMNWSVVVVVVAAADVYSVVYTIIVHWKMNMLRGSVAGSYGTTKLRPRDGKRAATANGSEDTSFVTGIRRVATGMPSARATMTMSSGSLLQLPKTR